MNITIPKLKKPTLKKLQREYSWIRSIESDTSPEEEVTLDLISVLKKEESYISKGVYEERIRTLPSLGYSQATWLAEHQDEFPEFMALLGKVYIDFSGLVVLNADGRRALPCLSRRGERWGLYWGWLGLDFNRYGRVAVSGKFSDSCISGDIESRILVLEEFKTKVEKILKV